MTTHYIGTSGWSYDHWGHGVFYPQGLPRTRWFSYYVQQFNSVEMNNTFYRLPQEKTFRHWGEQAPPGFVFALKASRYITHIKRLEDCKEELETFLTRAALLGEGRAGVVLYQTPPGLHRDDARLEAFLKLLPSSCHHAFEFRHASWFHSEVLAMLLHYGTGFCVQDMPGLDCPVAVTAPFAYFRFHGVDSAYSGCYSDDDLARWAGRVREAAGPCHTIYAYFNNDIGGHAVPNARTLRSLLTEEGRGD